MNNRQQQRAQRAAIRKQKKQRQALGCMVCALLVVILGSGAAIFHILDLSLPGWTGGMEPNPYSPEDFVRVNGYLTCTAGPTRLGLDVSEYQGSIDWTQVRSAGFDFVFVRIGYRGYTTGEILPDDRARENLDGARAAGLAVGAYFYAQAVSPEEAREEADWCLNQLSGFALDLPLVYDWEYVGTGARTDHMNRDQVTACFTAFCERVENSGYRSMIYFNPHVANDLLELEALADYPWWLAQYRDGLNFPYKVDFWQYTEEGIVPGIQGKVDIDLMFLS